LAFFVAVGFSRMPVIETVVNVPALQLQPQHRIFMLEEKFGVYFFLPILFLMFAF
jgi:hypothetical protein